MRFTKKIAAAFWLGSGGGMDSSVITSNIVEETQHDKVFSNVPFFPRKQPAGATKTEASKRRSVLSEVKPRVNE